MSPKKPPQISQQTTGTKWEDQPLTQTDIAWSLYLGDAYAKARKVLHSDARIMADCLLVVMARDIAKASGGSFKACMAAVNAKAKPTEPQIERAQALAAKRRAIRDAIVSLVEGGNGWDGMAALAQRPGTLRRIAATLHALGVHGEPPTAPAITRRRALTDDEMDRKAKAADDWAQEAV